MKKIFFSEDYLVYLEEISTLLQKEKYEVETCRSEEREQKYQKGYDLIITNLGGRFQGLHWIQKVREASDWTPAVFLTAHSLSEAEQNEISLYVQEIVPKTCWKTFPFKVLEAVRRLLPKEAEG
ncbi:MAG: response regulator [Gammaproteobacteria bacterium]|nr:response regulator [Gammaproteobacteria bacterium]